MNRNISTLLKPHKDRILIAILIIFYTVGTIGILMSETREYFLSLSFFNLLLSFSILVLARRTSKFNFIIFLVICYFTGMTAEWIGTKTGLLFGDYSYGENLGIQWSGVPVVIGLNWGILAAASASLVSRSTLPAVPSAVLSSLLMTLLDVLLEPVAMKSDFWSWTDGNIPFYNFFCWFIISLPLHLIYFKFKLSEPNKVHDTLFIIMILFFTLLNIF
ncbi:MAG: carotenoid biosynthesis protein [Cryomorphaceae bacterium]|jgi:putative membrane protein|nr:carotenoid biosynthesis protein [Cryomorphaceae bacterium]